MANFRAIGGGEVSASINNPNVLLNSSIITEPTMASGVTNYVDTDGQKQTYYYKVGTRVFVSIGAYIASGSFSGTIFTLPEGYRPQRRIFTSARRFNDSSNNGTIVVYTDVKVNATSSDQGLLGWVEFDAFQ